MGLLVVAFWADNEFSLPGSRYQWVGKPISSVGLGHMCRAGGLCVSVTARIMVSRCHAQAMMGVCLCCQLIQHCDCMLASACLPLADSMMAQDDSCISWITIDLLGYLVSCWMPLRP